MNHPTSQKLVQDALDVLDDRQIGKISVDKAGVQPQVRAGQATVRCGRGGVCRRRPGVALPRTDDEIPVFGNASEVFDVIDQPGARWAKPGNPGDGAGPTRRLGQPARASHKTRRREHAGWLGRDEQFHPQSERSVP